MILLVTASTRTFPFTILPHAQRCACLQLMVDTYGHLVPGSNRSAVDRLDDVSTHPAATPAQPETKKGLASSANPLISLVAGAGFEPVTYRL